MNSQYYILSNEYSLLFSMLTSKPKLWLLSSLNYSIDTSKTIKPLVLANHFAILANKEENEIELETFYDVPNIIINKSIVYH